LGLVEDERPIVSFEIVADHDAALNELAEFLEGLFGGDAFGFDAFSGDAVDLGGLLEAGPGFRTCWFEDAVKLFIAF